MQMLAVMLILMITINIIFFLCVCVYGPVAFLSSFLIEMGQNFFFFLKKMIYFFFNTKETSVGSNQLPILGKERKKKNRRGIELSRGRF